MSTWTSAPVLRAWRRSHVREAILPLPTPRPGSGCLAFFAPPLAESRVHLLRFAGGVTQGFLIRHPILFPITMAMLVSAKDGSKSQPIRRAVSWAFSWPAHWPSWMICAADARYLPLHGRFRLGKSEAGGKTRSVQALALPALSAPV